MAARRLPPEGLRRRGRLPCLGGLPLPVLALVALAAVPGGCGSGGGGALFSAWARQAGGDADDFAQAIAAFPDGSSVVVGSFESEAVFGAGEAAPTHLVASPGSTDAFLARYRADGTLAWAVRAGGGGYDVARSVATLPDGSIFVAGLFQGTAVFGSGVGTVVLATTSGYAAFVARYLPDGNVAWARAVHGADGMGVSAAPDGTCVATGSFAGTATFGAGEPHETSISTAGLTAYDAFVARFQASGNLDWAVGFGDVDSDQGYGVAALPDGSCYIAGEFSGTVAFGPPGVAASTLTSDGLRDAFVARFSPGGALLWVRRAGGAGSDFAFGVAALEDGAVVTGAFYETATFGPGEPGEVSLVSGGFDDAFVARYASDGTLAWAKRVGGPDSQQATSVAALAGGAALVTGWFQADVTLGAGELRETTIVTAHEGMFVARYRPDGNLEWATGAPITVSGGGAGVAAAPGGGAIVAVRFRETMKVGSNPVTQVLLTTKGLMDVAVVRFGSDGSF